MKIYNVRDWCWFVGDANGQVYSSKAKGFIADDDPTYLQFIEEGGIATSIASLDELREVFAQQYPDGYPADAVEAKRRVAYRDEADPLFFKYQRGEATKDEWLAKVAEIQQRFPKP